MRRLKSVVLVLLALAVAPALAQVDCPAIVQTVIANLDNICSGTERNEACYGNVSILATPQEGVSQFQFEQVGDIEGVAQISSIRMSALNEQDDAWGVALMRLQANLPDTLPGENVTFLLFGDVELVNAVAPGDPNLRPMQAFYLRTGIGDAACAEAPESGLMIRTPEGRGEIAFAVNGVDVTMGSDVFLQAQPGGFMTAKTFGGTFGVNTPDGQSGGISGTEVRIPMSEDLMPAGPPVLGTYDPTNTNLPPDLFGEVSPPLDDEQVQLIQLLIDNGVTPCGTAPFLPPCDNVISSLGGGYCPINDEGEEDCDAEQVTWEDASPPPYSSVTVWDTIPAGPGGNVPPHAEPTSELPPGCTPGICLQDPAQACQCALCGVECPADAPPPVETEVDCAVDPTNPACQQSNGGGGTGGGGGDTGGGGNGGGGEAPGVPVPSPEGPAPTEEPSDCPDGQIRGPNGECSPAFPGG